MDKKVGGIKTNPFMQTSEQDIFAVGDIASFPSWYVGENIRSEHWNTA
jgi:NADPH-dependent 2,4-dienoyl-CoA reductase/sulfur reductase-like enzyme